MLLNHRDCYMNPGENLSQRDRCRNFVKHYNALRPDDDT